MKLLGKLTRPLKRIRANLSELLPNGQSAFTHYCDEVIDLYRLPDTVACREAIARAIQFLPDKGNDRASKRTIVGTVRRMWANETAFVYIDHQIRRRKQAEIDATINSEANKIVAEAMNQCPEMTHWDSKDSNDSGTPS
jgi:hypothetical protein